ncbi:MAG TPA: amino acid permease [Gemmataceae bacterium]|jgi:APA family basic amino acid/polyamine antiporter
MFWKQLFATRSIDDIKKDVTPKPGNGDKSEDPGLHRALGPIALTAMGIGAIIGSGIFVMTGRVAAQDAGPAVVLSFVVAGVGCLFAALCYAEFASMVPVAGSAYTYAYATLGELFAWIIGWDLILEYAMACACVASSWSKYLNELLLNVNELLFRGQAQWLQIPAHLSADPFSTPGAWFNLPALLITLAVTAVLVIGIRESARTNATLVAVKIGVVLFVIVAGIGFISSGNYKKPHGLRVLPEELLIPAQVKEVVEGEEHLEGKAAKERAKQVTEQAMAAYKLAQSEAVAKKMFEENELTKDEAEEMVQRAEQEYGPALPENDADKALVEKVLARAKEKAPAKATEKWGILGLMGLNQKLASIDDSVRSPFMPYGLAGIIFGASIVFFAYIGFDAVSTQAEEAIKPHRDVPIAILASLVICTLLYIGVAAVITGMVPYYEISSEAAVASAFRQKAGQGPGILRWAALFISVGALAGMTSVLMVSFLGQSRIFFAMARDRLLPSSIFATIHPRFRTPHRSTMLTGALIALVAALTPITKLEEMVNIGTLMAFVIVCAAVLLLRVRRPDLERHFRTPALFLMAPLGILVNLIMMLFLPLDTWIRLVVWLAVGLVIYFSYGQRHSRVGQGLRGLVPVFGFGGADGRDHSGALPLAPDAPANLDPFGEVNPQIKAKE